MNTTEIEQLHERALDLYVEGRYLEARDTWQEILSVEPGDARAQEGARMVEILVEERPAAPPEAVHEPGPGDLPEDVTEEASRIEELSQGGYYREAADAARQLAGAHPDRPALQDLLRRTRERVEAAAFIDAELTRALKDLQLEDPDDARRACGNVLALDPQHARAHQLLELAEELSAQTASSSKPPSSSISPRPSMQTTGAGSPVAEPAQLAKQAEQSDSLHRTDDSVSSGLFDMPNEEVTAIPIRSFGEEDLSEGDAAAAPVAGRGNAPFAATDEPLFEVDEDAPIALDDTEMTSTRLDHAAENQAPGGSEDEGAQVPGDSGEAKERGSAFSEIDSEIDESLEVPSGEGDLSFDATDVQGQDAQPSAPSADTTLSADLSFDDEIADAPSDARGPSSMGSDTSGQATSDGRIAALIREARDQLQRGRYSEAIESAARAFAIDEEAPGARQLIDEARRLQDEADREAEEALDSARHSIEAGDDDSAEPMLRKVLSIHPGHREVLEMLDGLSRRRTEKEIAGAFVSTSDSGSYQGHAKRETLGPQDDVGGVALPKKPPPMESGPEPEAMVPRSHGVDVAPRVASAPADGAAKVSATASRKTGKRLLFIAVLGLGLALAAAIGLYLATRMLAPEEPADLQTAAPGPARKQVIHVDKTPGKAAPTILPAPPRTLSDAKKLLSEGSLDEAREALLSIVGKDPSDVQSVGLLKSVQERIAKRDETERAMRAIVSAYTQERYEDALRMLYRMPAEEQRGDVELFKANAWYNTGIQNLLGGNCTEAIHSFDEALAINTRDEGARRLKDYAKSYLGREKDTAYLIYVENLPKRPLTDR